MAAHNELGKWGEELAVGYLQQASYTIIERDWKSGRRDIDIIAHDGSEIVFIEVKTRRSDYFGTPIEAVDWKKRKNLVQAINHYIKTNGITQRCRFDVISIIGTPTTGEPRISHVKDIPLY